jgi:hypothetical protein
MVVTEITAVGKQVLGLEVGQRVLSPEHGLQSLPAVHLEQ